MKTQLNALVLAAIALALPASGLAAEKKKTAFAATPAATAADNAKKPAEQPTPAVAPATSGAKVIGMYIRVDSIDVAGKTFTHKNKPKKVSEPPKEVKFVLTDKTEIKNGTAPARFGDIKVGDTGSGSRIKKSDTEYEVVKITKFGVVAPKKADEPKKP